MGPSPHPTETDLLVTQVFRRNAEQRPPPQVPDTTGNAQDGTLPQALPSRWTMLAPRSGDHQFPSVFILPLEGNPAHWCGLLRRALFLRRLLPVPRWIRRGGNQSRRSESSDRLCQVPEHRAGSSPQLKDSGSWSKFNKATGLGGPLIHSSTCAHMPFAGK